MNTNSNTYIIIYSAILVVIVAFLLAFVYKALKPMQDANVELDIKKQILYSLNIRGLDGQEAENKYAEVVLTEVEKDGVKYYGCKIDGQTKYVFPLKGMGLWGGISAFVSVNDDLNTIYGAYFNHESETAGLGAEIKDSQAWQELFQGKKIFDENGNTAIAVVKKVENPASEVDCVTGATLTSNGVSDMLRDGLAKGVKLLQESADEPKAEEE
ncbi:MAG: FMN-binding protein [Prevotella sp.]|nr:FMN-binding protein [Prevotella sp.]